MDRFDEQAYELVTGPHVRRAFDIEQEDPRLRDRYGRGSWGQCTLLARRLVEAGSTFVTCHFGGWDHHWNLESGMDRICRKVDMAVSALFEDLDRARAAARPRAGRAVRRVQPHAADERRRQRRSAVEQGDARPRSLGELDVLPDGRRRHPGGTVDRLDRSARRAPEGSPGPALRHPSHKRANVMDSPLLPNPLSRPVAATTSNVSSRYRPSQCGLNIMAESISSSQTHAGRLISKRTSGARELPSGIRRPQAHPAEFLINVERAFRQRAAFVVQCLKASHDGRAFREKHPVPESFGQFLATT